MSGLLDLAGGLLLLAGTAFLLFGGLGLVRMPDVYNRIQAGTKATTLGTLLSLAGVACLHPGWGFKLLLIGLFLLFIILFGFREYPKLGIPVCLKLICHMTGLGIDLHESLPCKICFILSTFYLLDSELVGLVKT